MMPFAGFGVVIPACSISRWKSKPRLQNQEWKSAKVVG